CRALLRPDSATGQHQCPLTRRAPMTTTLTLQEEIRTRFERAWRTGRPEPIERFLPSGAASWSLPLLQDLVLLELRLAWQESAGERGLGGGGGGGEKGPAPAVESYLERFPQLNQPQIVLRLAQEEYRLRHSYGDRPPAEEYQARFPGVITEAQMVKALLETAT